MLILCCQCFFVYGHYFNELLLLLQGSLRFLFYSRYFIKLLPLLQSSLHFLLTAITLKRDPLFVTGQSSFFVYSRYFIEFLISLQAGVPMFLLTVYSLTSSSFLTGLCFRLLRRGTTTSSTSSAPHEIFPSSKSSVCVSPSQRLL